MKQFRSPNCASLAVLLLAACTATQQPPSPAGEAVFTTTESRAVIALLDAFQQWQTLPAESLDRELAAANAAYVQEPNGTSRLRLALLLSMPNTLVRNDARALSLLGPVLAAEPVRARPLRELALLLQTQIAERQRAINEEQKRSEDLARKLEALRKLEHSLIEREQKARDK